MTMDHVYVTIPNTTLSVSSVCLGTAELGTVVPRAEAFRLLDMFVDLGGNFLDTALVYANWIPGERSVSEKTLGAWMRARGNRDRIVVATKGAHPQLATMDVPRLSPAEIRADVEASLAHLQVNRIDLYYLHRDDALRPVGEIMGTLHELVQAGKLRYVGCSNWCADRIAAAQAYAQAHGFVGFVADQMLWIGDCAACISRRGWPRSRIRRRLGASSTRWRRGPSIPPGRARRIRWR
jgi:aryl-alcohol dehydrogenase-like predicted oxidoreductase